MVQRLVQRGAHDLQRRPGSGNLCKIHETESSCLEQYQQLHPDAFLHEYAARLEEQMPGTSQRDDDLPTLEETPDDS